jgi:hypothetical protein
MPDLNNLAYSSFDRVLVRTHFGFLISPKSLGSSAF